MAAEGPTSRRNGRVHVKEMVAIGAVASVIGIVLGLVIDWFPTAASSQAGPIDTLWDVCISISVPIFVLVSVVVLYSAWRFRVRAGEELLDGPPIHGNTRLEIIWTAIPAILLVGMCSYAYGVLTNIESAKANTTEVRVVGEQFTWTFYYRDPTTGKTFANPQLYVAKGQPVHFTVQSKDVIHDFWVPAFRVKIDAVPGISTQLRVTPTRLGDYPVVCAELCGLGHAVMRQTAHVLTPQAYDAWLKKAAANMRNGGGSAANDSGSEGGAAASTSGGEGTAAAGKAIFTSAGCGGCHKLADAGAAGQTGPDLDTALKGKDEAFIHESIVDPNAEITKGYAPNIMPASFGQTLSKTDLDGLVKYLHDVTSG
jgi:cytochrome c oxidase subunit 2